jgi:hypothetical protein
MIFFFNFLLQLVAYTFYCTTIVMAMETRLAAFSVDMSEQIGEVILFIGAVCGMRPVIAWPNVSSYMILLRHSLVSVPT